MTRNGRCRLAGRHRAEEKSSHKQREIFNALIIAQRSEEIVRGRHRFLSFPVPPLAFPASCRPAAAYIPRLLRLLFPRASDGGNAAAPDESGSRASRAARNSISRPRRTSMLLGKTTVSPRGRAERSTAIYRPFGQPSIPADRTDSSSSSYSPRENATA